MVQLAFFIFFMLFAVMTLIVAPVVMHPTLSGTRKWQINLIAFFVVVPLSIVIYLWVGVPQMADLR